MSDYGFRLQHLIGALFMSAGRSHPGLDAEALGPVCGRAVVEAFRSGTRDHWMSQTPKLFDIIQAAITENFDAESVVTLSDGRQIITQADPEAVEVLAREIEAAILAAFEAKQ